ncbi:hypothetical protein [Paenibacillus sp. TH7-28]
MFILLEHSLRPCRMRGNKVIPATIIPLDKERLEINCYIGMKSGARVRVLNFGGHIKPAPESKDAFYLSDVIPATLDESASNAMDGEVFIPVSSSCKVELLAINDIKPIYWPESLNGYWISVSFNQKNQIRGYGWFCKKNELIGEAVLVNGELENDSPTIIKGFRSFFQKTVECECKGAAQREVWHYKPGRQRNSVVDQNYNRSVIDG